MTTLWWEHIGRDIVTAADVSTRAADSQEAPGSPS